MNHHRYRFLKFLLKSSENMSIGVNILIFSTTDLYDEQNFSFFGIWNFLR